MPETADLTRETMLTRRHAPISTLPMEILALTSDPDTVVTDFGAVATRSRTWLHGAGEAHIHTVRFDPGGGLTPHPTGYSQLFIPLSGTGWVSGADDVRVPLSVGQAAFFRRGERHAKGSETGLVALMIQVRDLAPPTPSQ